MNHLKNRAISLLLAVVMFLGMIPPTTITASAAGDDSIRLTGCDFIGTSYTSPAIGRASIHTMQDVFCQGVV